MARNSINSVTVLRNPGLLPKILEFQTTLKLCQIFEMKTLQPLRCLKSSNPNIRFLFKNNNINITY